MYLINSDAVPRDISLFKKKNLADDYFSWKISSDTHRFSTLLAAKCLLDCEEIAVAIRPQRFLCVFCQ